jgi:hypothetical protein
VSRFDRGADFLALSVRDLADARDAYHVHLANLDNVVGTALGRFLIRRDDPDFKDPTAKKPEWPTQKRTLANTRVTPWSWPCVLVFVKEWMEKAPCGADADQVVPRLLYLPDGRQVPTCVVYSPLSTDSDRRPQMIFGSTMRGGGQPLFTDDQGRRRMGTIGALVTDGSRVYALTSRHVLGQPGSTVTVADRGEMVPIGTVASSASHRSLQSLYPGIAGTRAEVNLDAGLVALESVTQWTTQIYGVGILGDVINLNVDTLALSLIGCPVTAFGAASGEMKGAVLGLFHRWRSVGGVDEIAELLIGPRPGETGVFSRPGDSGALWVWDQPAEKDTEGDGTAVRQFLGRSVPMLRPLGLQWGGQVVLDPEGSQPTDYVLASTISGVVHTLDVTVLNDDSLADHSLYWGKVGHYKIAESACHLGQPGTSLAKLLNVNLDRIAVSDDKIKAGELPSAAQRDKFIALADVPDLVWRSTRQKDAPSHFADMDEPGGAKVNHATLLQLWRKGGKWRTPAGWTEFYDSLAKPPVDKHRGALPFRVAQLYQIMVDAVTDHDLARYICAAGVLAHYVGDACQPLHVSRLHHGDPDNPEDDEVHEAYETDMLDQFAPEVVTGVNSVLQKYHAGDTGGPRLVDSPEEAAAAVVDLMNRTIKALHPIDILNVFDAHPGAGRTKQLWEEFEHKTIERLADGARTLAVLWRSAWEEGGGESLAAASMAAQSKTALQTLYQDKTFAPNSWLRELARPRPVPA